jgi:hypothetical protein
MKYDYGFLTSIIPNLRWRKRRPPAQALTPAAARLHAKSAYITGQDSGTYISLAI